MNIVKFVILQIYVHNVLILQEKHLLVNAQFHILILMENNNAFV